MKNLVNPKWIFVINTLPIVILLYLCYADYSVIKTLLSDINIYNWKLFGVTVILSGVGNIVYAVYLNFRKKRIHILYGLLSLVVNIGIVYMTAYKHDDIIPWNIPRWMQSGDLFIYVGTFLMPSIAYSLFLIVLHFSEKIKKYQEWKDLGIAILIPISTYLFVQIFMPLWQKINFDFNVHIIVVSFIIGLLLVLFFLIRSIYILTSRKSEFLNKNQLFWKIPIALLFPFVGLLLNNGYFSKESYATGLYLFGNFSNQWFYFLCLFNGILLCLPNLKKKNYRLGLFVTRSITLSYTFYFFVVFLPFFPLTILTVFVFGLGLFALSPLVLFVLHISEITRDYDYLKSFLSITLIRSISFIGFIILPIIITINFVKDRQTLHSALDYVYNPDYTKNTSIDNESLEYTMAIVKMNRGRNQGAPFGLNTPYISSYFNWIVLDNLSLSDKKINTIEQIFFNKTKINFNTESIDNSDVIISKATTESTFDDKQKAWKSWVNLEIENHTNEQAEYTTTFELPNGAWISDYYLFVKNKKEHGLLCEKKSAMWVFSQIRNRRKDPGLLYYLTGNKIAFRIFPFEANETRKTGFQLIHREPINFSIDNFNIQLGGENNISNSLDSSNNENVVYISAKEKINLQRIKRDSYFHFLIDNSQYSDSLKNENISKIEYLKSHFPSHFSDAKFTFVNSYVSEPYSQNNWKEGYNNTNPTGGFYLDRAIKKELIKCYKSKQKKHPVFVIISDNLYGAVLENDFADLAFTFPDNKFFFHLDKDFSLNAHSLMNHPLKIVKKNTKTIESEKVGIYTHSDGSVDYIKLDDQASILLKKGSFNISQKEIQEKNWNTGLTLQGQRIYNTINPQDSEAKWLDMIKTSFKSKIMIPETSYIVVENEAQKAALLRKQKEVLASKKSLDIGNEAQAMSEPSLWLIILLFSVFFWLKNRKTKISN